MRRTAHQGSGGALECHHERGRERGRGFQVRTKVTCGGLFTIVSLKGVNVSTFVLFVRFDRRPVRGRRVGLRL